MFQNVAVRDARHNTDHYLILGFLQGAAPAVHSRYLGNQTRFPIRPPATSDRIDRIFTELWGAITKLHWMESLHQKCISPETWRLIDTRIAARQCKDLWSARALSHMIQAIIQEYRCRRAANIGSEMKYLLVSDFPLIQEAWIQMRGLYKKAVDRTPTPSRVATATMMEEQVDIYCHVSPPGQPIPMGDLNFLVDDSITEDKETAWEVRRIRLNHSGGLLGMKAEHLRQWLVYYTQDNSRDATNWQKVVAIVQEAFRDGALDEEITWQKVVLIPKGASIEFRGIGLVEVLWKAVTSLLN